MFRLFYSILFYVWHRESLVLYKSLILSRGAKSNHGEWPFVLPILFLYSPLYFVIPHLWESNINVWFQFMKSQKWNCAASLFPKQNYNILSPISYTHVSVRDLYISRIDLSILLQQNMWTYVIPILGTHKFDSRYSAWDINKINKNTLYESQSPA